jgi:hypothetical protein
MKHSQHVLKAQTSHKPAKKSYFDTEKKNRILKFRKKNKKRKRCHQASKFALK